MTPKNKAFNITFPINCGGNLWMLDGPCVMGVLNITPDSFYCGSRVMAPEQATVTAGRMLEEGAAILDIGGQSTRPGAALLSAREEAERVLPVIGAILERYPEARISIDTFHAEVAEAAVQQGCVMVNDISAGLADARMLDTVAALGVPFIAMHMQGMPATMQQAPHYDDVVGEVMDHLARRREGCLQAGIQDVLLDPGFGFGKSIAHNYTLLRHLDVFRWLDAPLVVGVSRKSMIWKLLEIAPEDALNGTTVLHTLALERGATILRAHDVRAAMEAIRLWQHFRGAP